MISKRGLMQEAKKHRETIPMLENFYRTARKSKWNGLHEVRRQFPSADQVGSVLIFDIMFNSLLSKTDASMASGIVNSGFACPDLEF